MIGYGNFDDCARQAKTHDVSPAHVGMFGSEIVIVPPGVNPFPQVEEQEGAYLVWPERAMQVSNMPTCLSEPSDFRLAPFRMRVHPCLIVGDGRLLSYYCLL